MMMMVVKVLLLREREKTPLCCSEVKKWSPPFLSEGEWFLNRFLFGSERILKQQSCPKSVEQNRVIQNSLKWWKARHEEELAIAYIEGTHKSL